MRLYRQTVEDFGLYTGKELSDREMDALRDAAGRMSALPLDNPRIFFFLSIIRQEKDMDIKCRKTECKYNDRFVCQAKKIDVDKTHVCRTFEKSEEKVNLKWKSK